MRYLLLIFTLVACGTEAHYGIEIADDQDVPGTWETVDHAIVSYDRDLPADVWWTETECWSETRQVWDTCVIHNGLMYHGLIPDRGKPCLMYVAKKPDGVKSSALFHELGHCARKLILGRFDAVHEDDAWWQQNKEFGGTLDCSWKE